MKLKLFKTLWGFTGRYQDAINDAIDAQMAGIEGPAPQDVRAAKDLYYQLQDAQLDFIAEITTAGSYVPDRNASVQQHLESLALKIEQALRLKPLFITCLGGCDAWPEEKNLEFLHRAMELADAFGVEISFETHRGRAFFNPWITQRLVQQLPGIKLTCDFSHWCVVCERLIDSDVDVIEALTPYAHHIHARVGYDQGPQVPHPAAPEYQHALRAHQRWWQMIWETQSAAGYQFTTMTPEFGPDGYLHEQPFTRIPVADLWQINQWMAAEEQQHFRDFQHTYETLHPIQQALTN